MATDSGFSNQKKFGPSQYKTIHNVGSDKFADNVITKDLLERQTLDIALVAVEKDFSEDGHPILLLEIPNHGCPRAGDVVLFKTGLLENVELDVIEVISPDILSVYDVMESLPQAGDGVRTAYYKTPNGSLSVSIGATQFVQDGQNVPVTEDTSDPSLNKPFPSGMFLKKDGEYHPVTKDTSDSSKTVAVPVEIVSGSGTEINITAGDIDIHTSSEGANFDSMRIGDGSGNYVGVNAGGEALVHDAEVLTELETLNTVDFATEAKQDSIITELETLNTVDFATEAKQDSIITELETLNTVDFATESTVNAIKTKINSMAAGLVPQAFDHMTITYVSSTTDIQTVVYRVGGSGGTVVATVTITYDGGGNISTVART